MVKDSLDFLVRRNDDVLHQIDALHVESGLVRNEYLNLAKDMRSLLDELKDETIIERQYDSEKCDKTEGKSDCSQIETLRRKLSKNSVGYLDRLASTVKSSTKDGPISKTFLGSFLASMLWLKKREAHLSKSPESDIEVEPTISDSTVRMICEMLGESEETEERNSDSLCKESTGADNDSDSAFEDAFSSPPPSPPSSFFELKPKPSVTCMDDLTKGDKNKNVMDTFGSAAPIAVLLMEEIKSTVRHFESEAAVTTRTGQELEKFPQAVELTIPAGTTAGAFDVTVKNPVGVLKRSKKGREIKYSCDSLDNLTDFDSDDLATSSLSGGDEMEEFRLINPVALNTDSKAMQSRGNNPPILTTFKTPKPIFFEVLKCYPKLFMQEMVSRTARTNLEEDWETKEQNNTQVVAVVPREKRQQEVVIENGNLDLVIYIQVEVEDDGKKEQMVLDFETNSFGTQTSSQTNKFPTLEDPSESETQEIRKEPEESASIASNEITKLHDGKKAAKTVAFADEVSEIFIKKNTPCESEKTEKAVALTIKEEILTANVYFEQLELCPICLVERPKPFYRAERNVELEKALELIHEIENDVVDTKLSDAILILPRLESELRKHFKQKVKSLGDSEFTKSFETFFSAFDVWPVEVTNDTESEGSGERFYNLLALLDDLEKAIKASETEVELCPYDSSKIYGLLHALTENIRELEDYSNVSSLSQTLDITSKVDTAIRQFENILKRTPTENAEKMSKKHSKRSKSQTSGEIPEHLKNVRKRVFQMVEEEAIDTEARLEKDSDKLLRLERQNDEAMKFVEAFLEKTQRRVSELASVREQLKELSESLAGTYEEIVKANLRKKSRGEESKEGELDTSARDVILKAEQPVKETISGLLLALDNLKSRARQKNELCRGILSTVSIEKEIEERDPSTRSSRSSFTAKNVEGLYSWVKDFKKIGDQNLYLSWTMPEGLLVDSLVGYEIFVNGKLNQKVRNPKRLQAILYSIDLSRMAEVLLYGLLENGFKIFLASVTYTS